MKKQSLFWKVLNTIYYFVNIPFGVIVINSWITQKCNKVVPNNIGDDINFYLIKLLSGKAVVNYRSIFHFRRAIENLMCIGSTIEWMTNSSSIIWGSGVMYGSNNPTRKMRKIPHKICAVRGPLSRDYLQKNGIVCPEVYGDPALLLPLVYKNKVNKLYKVGIVPHFYDYDLDIIWNTVKKNSKDVIVIDVSHYNKWTDVIDLINQCDFIISSSLHGLIISDAYKIPNIWVTFSDSMKGGSFKFQDYYLSTERKIFNPINLKGQKYIDLEGLRESALSLYSEPHISLTSLLRACPFKINSDYLNRII